jgi:hypothetical protein
LAKKRWWVFLAVLLLLVVGPPSRVWAQAQAQWTFMVYLDGDNDLEQFAVNNFLQMAAVGSDANINIVVQFDRWDNPAKDKRYGNWTTCKRFLVTQGMEPVEAQQLADLGEVDMGNPATLTDFINWATSSYPAANYALVLWDHGSGWDPGTKKLLQALKQATTKTEKKKLLEELKAAKRAQPAVKWICEDASHGTMLSLADVKNAISGAGTKVQLVGFDACLMGMVEMAYEIKDTGPGVMVGSEEIIPGNGWPYDTILAGLQSNPAWTARDLGSWIVDKYYEYYSITTPNNGGMTQSAIDLTQMNNLAGRITDFASAMRSSWDSDRPLIKTRAQDVMTAIQQAVIKKRHGLKNYPGAYGLAIYFPIYGFDSQYDSNNLDLANNTTWDEFLLDYLDHLGGSWIAVARDQSQYFEEFNNIDLYDFCDRLVKGTLERLRYTCVPAPYNFEDISQDPGATKLSIVGDDNFATVPPETDPPLAFVLPFDLPFFGGNHTDINVSANGALYFVPYKISFASQPIPSLGISGVNAFIAPFWDDLVPSAGGGVCYMVRGTAPDRRLIVQWQNVPHYIENTQTPKGVTFQVIFYERSPDILFQYKDVTFGNSLFDYGASATVGIQRNSFSGTQYSYHSPVLQNESALRFRLHPGRIIPVLQLLLLD